MFLQEGLHQSWILVQVEGHHLDAFAFLGHLVELFDMRKFCHARSTPGRPDSDEGCSSGQILQTPGLARHVSERKLGQLLVWFRPGTSATCWLVSGCFLHTCHASSVPPISVHNALVSSP